RAAVAQVGLSVGNDSHARYRIKLTTVQIEVTSYGNIRGHNEVVARPAVHLPSCSQDIEAHRVDNTAAFEVTLVRNITGRSCFQSATIENNSGLGEKARND